MLAKIIEKQIKKYGQDFIIERQINLYNAQLPIPEPVPKPSSTGFLDFSHFKPDAQTQLNTEPNKTKTYFTLTAVRLNSQDKLIQSDVGVSSESRLRLMTLLSFSEKLPLKETDIIFQDSKLEAGKVVVVGIRYIIKQALKTIKYKTTELLSYEIQEQEAT